MDPEYLAHAIMFLIFTLSQDTLLVIDLLDLSVKSDS